MQLLGIKDLTVEVESNIIVDSINLTIDEGEILAVVGKSGSGKTMTFKAATGLLSPKQFKISGNINWYNKSYLPNQMAKLLGKDISYVMQNPMTAFNPVITIGSHCRETLTHHLHVSKKEADNIAKKWFLKLKLQDVNRIFSSYCYELSGGMLQRVMLALSMAVGSKLIIADEPTTALDTITQKNIIHEFSQMNKNYGVSIVFISHDFAILSQIADNVAVISNGKLIEYESTQNILSSPKQLLTKKMLKELSAYA